MKERIGDLARYFIGTYDLPPRLQERILTITASRLNEEGILSVDRIYTLIDGLVTKFTEPYKKPLSLDQEVSRDGHTTFHDIIGLPEPIESHQMSEQYTMSLREIGEILERSIEPDNLSLFYALLQKGNSEVGVNITYDEVIAKAMAVNKKLNELRRVYGREGEILLPPRQIISVNFTPLKVRFKRRTYQGNPLEFYRKNKERYLGLSRWELCKFDAGLYISLWKRNQLEIAIPENQSSHELSQQEKNKIVGVYPLCEKDPNQASRLLGRYSTVTILKYWKDVGLEIRGRGHQSKPKNQQ